MVSGDGVWCMVMVHGVWCGVVFGVVWCGVWCGVVSGVGVHSVHCMALVSRCCIGGCLSGIRIHGDCWWHSYYALALWWCFLNQLMLK